SGLGTGFAAVKGSLTGPRVSFVKKTADKIAQETGHNLYLRVRCRSAMSHCRTCAVRQLPPLQIEPIRYVCQGAAQMARRNRQAKLDSRSARARLVRRREPYWTPLSGGLALGYRKGATGGSWIARQYSGERGRQYHALGAA